MSDERTKILDMLAAGQINAQDAAAMLGAVGKAPTEPEPVVKVEKIEKLVVDADEAHPAVETIVVEIEEEESAAPAKPRVKMDIDIDLDDEPARVKSADAARTKKRLRIVVTDVANDRRRVDITLPAGLLRFGARLGRRFAPEVDGLDWDDVDEMLAEGMRIDVTDEDEHVEVYLE